MTVIDTNVEECDGDPNTTADWDGDYDAGVGGAFFGYGAWVEAAGCGYHLNVHGANVAINDIVFGSSINFVVGEDDGRGPTLIGLSGGKVQAQAGTTEHATLAAAQDSAVACETDGVISPNSARGDCLSPVYQGRGATCGSGGGDGGYWVFLLGTGVAEELISIGVDNPPTSGTITAF